MTTLLPEGKISSAGFAEAYKVDSDTFAAWFAKTYGWMGFLHRFETFFVYQDLLKFLETNEYKLASYERTRERTHMGNLWESDTQYYTKGNSVIVVVAHNNVPIDEEAAAKLLTDVRNFEIYIGSSLKEDTDNLVPQLTALVKPAPVQKDVPHIHVITTSHGQLHARPLELIKPEMSLDLHYGTGFAKRHAEILKSINEEVSGVYLFHGEPGTGKSTYIQYLSAFANKPVLLIPASLASHLANPDMLGFLLEHRDSILVIEDAEKVIEKRSKSADPSVISNVLNIGDGFLGRGLNLSIVMTFNTDEKNIDPAVLRAGRLKHKHYFRKLSIKDGAAMAKHLGKKTKVTKSLSLAEIYALAN